MATLNSQSTIEEIIAAYRDNASYEEDGSVAKARAFATAVRFLLGMPKRERKGGQGAGAEAEYDTEVLERQLNDALEYVSTNGTDRPTLDVDFTDFDRRR